MSRQTDLAEQVIVPNLPWIIGGGMVLGLIAILAWVLTTWLRIKHGYPLETSWGKSVEPRMTTETAERMKLISSENAQLRAELGAVKDRLANVERIVTDDSHRLTQEIDTLRDRGH
jgi:predicted metal-binding membrane protein